MVQEEPSEGQWPSRCTLQWCFKRLQEDLETPHSIQSPPSQSSPHWFTYLALCKGSVGQRVPWCWKVACLNTTQLSVDYSTWPSFFASWGPRPPSIKQGENATFRPSLRINQNEHKKAWYSSDHQTNVLSLLSKQKRWRSKPAARGAGDVYLVISVRSLYKILGGSPTSLDKPAWHAVSPKMERSNLTSI